MGRPHHIRLNKIERVNIGIRDGNEGAQVEDRAASFYRFLDPIRVLQVSHDDFQLIPNLSGQFLQEDPVIPRIVPNKGPDLFPLPDQFLGQMASDEPSRLRSQESFP